MKTRIVPVGLLPQTLWDEDVVRLPVDLVSIYRRCLTDLNLLNKATSDSKKKDIHGGPTRDETLEHFAQRFAVSAARIEVVSLDPKEQLAQVPDAILTTFSEGHVGVLDIPSGPLSSAASLLSTLCALRHNHLLPRLPLTVSVTGGDCSPTALELGDQIFRLLQPLLARQGIEIKWQLRNWDAIQAEDTAKLMDDWLNHAGDASEFVVCVSNFSGALIKAGLLREFQPCLEQILARMHNRKHTVLWVEPTTSDAIDRLIPRIWEFLRARLPRYLRSGDRDQALSSKYFLQHPLNERKLQTGVTVERFWRN